MVNSKYPLYFEAVKAGFPSPADDHIESKLNLDELLIKHPEATFFVRVSGDSMINAGIGTGDILVVDRSIEAINNKIIVAVIDGELTVKRLKKKNSQVALFPENPKYPVIEIGGEMEFSIWGVVTAVIKQY